MQMTLQFIIAALSNKIVIQFLLYIKIFLKTDPYTFTGLFSEPSSGSVSSSPLRSPFIALSSIFWFCSFCSSRKIFISSNTLVDSCCVSFPCEHKQTTFFKSQKYNMSPYTICSVDAFSKVI